MLIKNGFLPIRKSDFAQEVGLPRARNFAAILFFLLVAFSFAAPVLVHAADPLVPCTNTLKEEPKGSGRFIVENQCSACEVFTLSQNILNFFYQYITIPIATVMFLWAGFLMVFAGVSGAAGNYQKGGRIMKNTLIGIVIIFCSWLAIDTVIKVAAGKFLTAGPAQLPKSESRFGPWNEITCVPPKAPEFAAPSRPAPSPTPPPGPTPPPPVPTGDDFTRNRSNAAALAAQGIVFSSASGCGGVSASTNFEELRNSRPITICSSGCTASTVCKPDGRTADPKMLADLVVAAYGDDVHAALKFTVTSVATGNHASLSAHYAGKAVDLAPVGVPSPSKFLAIRDRMRELTPRVQCENNSGTITGCGSGTTHIHVSYP